MPKSSRVTNSIYQIPTFKSESEEAEWWYTNRNRLDDLLVKHGRMVPGREVERTQAISIRIPLDDIEAAKAIAKKKGIGYRTVLKEAIRHGLKKAG